MTCYAMRHANGDWHVFKAMRGTVQTALSWADSQGCDMLVVIDGARVRGYAYSVMFGRWLEKLWLGVMPLTLCVVDAYKRVDAAATLNNLERLSENEK